MQAISRTAGALLASRAALQHCQGAPGLLQDLPLQWQALSSTSTRLFASPAASPATSQAPSDSRAQLEQLAARLQAAEREASQLRSQLGNGDRHNRPYHDKDLSEDAADGGTNSSRQHRHSSEGSGEEEEQINGTDAASTRHAKENLKPKISAKEGTPEAQTEEALRALHPKIVAWLNAGHLESQRRVTEALIKQEWEGEVRPWAARKGVSDFEKHLAEDAEGKDIEGKAQEGGPGAQVHRRGRPDWEALSRLYGLLDAPTDKQLEELVPDEHHRMLARAFITQALFEQRKELYKRCSDQAKDLSDLAMSGKSSGFGAVWSAITALLPIPGFSKK